MPEPTIEAQLDQINTAIRAIETGAQEYRIGDRTVRRADLKVLYEQRKDLRAELSAALGHNIAVAVFDRR